MSSCLQEMCVNWSGDGRVCPCALFGLSPDEFDMASWGDQ